MRKLAALTTTCLLITSMALATAPSEADQKWLQIVEKKINAGQTEVSTPAPGRVELLKHWAADNGYSTQVTKTSTTYRVGLAKSVAQK